MGLTQTNCYTKIARMNGRINVVQGGTSAGKTFNILAMLLTCSFAWYGKLITVATDSFPNLKRGAIRDFKTILKKTKTTSFFIENKTEHTFLNSHTGTVIEFVAIKETGARGARRDYLFVNEANRIDFETFGQLEVRTKHKIWCDFNPVNKFWIHDEILPREDTDFIKVNYLDNSALDKNIVRTLEARRGDGTGNWWRVYGLGEIGSLEGNVYEGWQAVNDKPEGFVLKCCGVDFGFSKDPTAVVGIYEHENGDIFVKTYIYQSKLLNSQLIGKIQEIEGIKDALFVCDNARPEIIAEMCANGLRAIGCNKTAGEKSNGKMYNIELVQRRKVFYPADDKDLEREYLAYAWRKKKSTGEQLREPEDGNDHAMDAIAYGVREISTRTHETLEVATAGGYVFNEDEEEDLW